MTVTTELTIDLQRRAHRPQVVFAVQGDRLCRRVLFRLQSNGTDWVLPEQLHAAVCYHKPDGTGGIFDTLPDGSPACRQPEGNALLFTLPPQMTTCPGTVSCELQLTDGDAQLYSFCWVLEVSENVQSALESEDYFRFTTLNSLQEEIDTLEASLNALRDESDEADANQMTVMGIVQDNLLSQISALRNMLEQHLQAPAPVSDMTADYAAIRGNGKSPAPTEYLLDLPDGEYKLSCSEGMFFARLVTVGSCTYADIKQYDDDHLIYTSRYIDGKLAEEWCTSLHEDPNCVSASQIEYNSDQLDDLSARISALEGMFHVESWADVQKIVRLGLADKYFRIGDQLECMRGDQLMCWDIIGFDHDTPSDPQLHHTMTLQLHSSDVLPLFDTKDALLTVDSPLPAGSYCFTVTGALWAPGSSDEGKTFSFTTEQALPAGSQLVLGKNYDERTEGTSIIAYAGPGAAAQRLFSCTLHEGEDGTFLGRTDGSRLSSYTRAVIGSNRYLLSAVRQQLNSRAAAGQFWQPQTQTDREPYTLSTMDGFLHGMDEDFLAVLCPVEKITRDSGALTANSETVFLLSVAEVYGSGTEGSAYAYYRQQSDLHSSGSGADGNRIRYSTQPVRWWLRTARDGNDYSLRVVDATGAITYTNVNNRACILPACCIG